MRYVVVAAPPAVRTVEDLEHLPAVADLVELRLDLLPDGLDEEGVRRWVRACPRPVLATVRSRGEGGRFGGTPEAAARLLAVAAGAGAAVVDVEVPVVPFLRSLPPTTDTVVSRHGEGAFETALPDEVAGRPAGHLKAAAWVATPADLERLRGARRAPSSVPRTLVPYGPLGALRGAFAGPGDLLYGNADGVGTVPGQPPLLALLDELRAGEVGAEARLFGLLGRPPSRSPSPAMHNAVFRYLDRDAVYVPVEDLDPAAALALPFDGFSVTTPYKDEALGLADSADDRARRIGAANTLLRGPAGGWHAANTDADAVADLVPSAPPGAGAFVYGAGGFARAAALVLVEKGYDVRVGGRDTERALAVAEAVGARAAGDRYARVESDRVLVNATPAGVRGEAPSPLLASPLAGLLVLDAPYAAAGRPTGLAVAARAAGAELVDGRSLLVAQARGQAERFAGVRADDGVLRLACDPPEALVLLGLRGAGKSTVGRAVARRLGRPCLDLDEEVRRATGRSPADWIRDEGEGAFREVEAAALARHAARRGLVIAAGGGVTERPSSVRLLRSETWPVWLDLPAEAAAARVRASGEVRPRLAGTASEEEEARLLLARRAPAWTTLARARVDATRPVPDVARRIASLWASSRVRSP